MEKLWFTLYSKSIHLSLKPPERFPFDVAGVAASCRLQLITVLDSGVATVMEEKIPGIHATSRRPRFDTLTSLNNL